MITPPPVSNLDMPHDRRVVITAGASGIGRVIARTFIEHGARVAICDIDEHALAEFIAEFPDAITVQTDVADVLAVDTFFDAVESGLGGIDVMVNNAGIAGPTAAVDEMKPEDWDRCIAVNLNSQFYCARRAVPHLKTSSGLLINMSSVAGRLGYAYRTPYAASKYAIVGFTESLAKELGADGVRVNCIQPGIVEGPRIEAVIQARADQVGVSYGDMETNYLNNTSLHTMVSPQDIANMALFLATPAGHRITGQSISVCGNVENT